ncbi:oxidoreductase [Citromicrobium sp. RCC1885]|uniref:SDR family NAD(P)-dependent oxidoreductase n=1 Tax=unclassified Citromicrobium TaxID=2630544 RepID=UPI0006C91FFC|nr:MULTISPECIES: SDR family oxidoreductase [unclassified Citromicrobium]KPM23157.1 oxidoreductase [Citromicrobium sp. RCC1885]KPM26564.1 oxidoreductase [Citromicrobium sp. RCC1878]MAO04046.1 NAD(P)-dependent oxidoreductase [Citromicrobium sp.]OAM08921.1 oxidoreductase [Citromicrobium sp. RCC1897]|tara:strand:+ start:5746 stop:6504 length:759 start_codon:yes stop_codon:yes gene_type:complete
MTEGYDFTNRTALVTGAASGIGAACARWLDRNGIGKLVLIDLNGDDLGKLGLSCEVESHQADVADEGFWKSLEPQLDRLDHAVVNAGIGTGGQIADLDFAEWRRVMAINLDGAFLTLSTALRAMQRSGGGSAVVTASITGLKPVPGIGAYGVSKAAVAHMARIAAAENAGHGIRVNSIAPGGVDTAIWNSADNEAQFAEHGREAVIAQMGKTTPRGRFATADELARDIGYLLSDASANVTGTVLTSDGGYTL